MKRVVTIHVDDDDSVLTASIAGLSRGAAMAVMEAAQTEALKMLNTRAALRRFRHPVTIRHFDPDGNLIMKWDGFDWSWGDGSSERGEPGSIVYEDARGRKAIVRLVITR